MSLPTVSGPKFRASTYTYMLGRANASCRKLNDSDAQSHLSLAFQSACVLWFRPGTR